MKFDEARPFGIEIEATGVPMDRIAQELSANGIPTVVERYNHENRDHWKVVSDASVHGRFPFELVSPKLYGAEGLAEVKKVMKLVRQLGGRINASCGLHVHHSAQGLSGKQSRMVSHFYSALFEAFSGLFPLSRRHNVYARLVDPQEVHRMSDSDMRQGHNRYQAVNLLAIFKHGTIEFRQHQGSLNGDKATSWIVFTQQFMLGALRSKVTVSWRTKNLKVGLFNFWRLYDKATTIDEPCVKMLRFVAKRANWKVGKLIAARNGHEASTPNAMVAILEEFDRAEAPSAVIIDEVRSPMAVFPTFTSYQRSQIDHAIQCDTCLERRERIVARWQEAAI